MCLVCLLSFPLLYIHTSDLLSNIIRGAAYGTIFGSLVNNSLINILKCSKEIPAVHAALYSLPTLYLETYPVTCVTLSNVPH